MFKQDFVVVACLAAVVLARSPTYAKNLESKTREIVDSIKTDAADDNEIEELKLTLESIFEPIKNQAEASENNALQETDDVVMGNVKEDESVYLSGIIQKVKKCAKQIIEESKDKIASLMEELKRIMEDMSKIRDCKGTKEERHECIKQNMDLVNQDISALIEDSSKQIQWLMNDILPDFYQCITTDQYLLIK